MRQHWEADELVEHWGSGGMIQNVTKKMKL